MKKVVFAIGVLIVISALWFNYTDKLPVIGGECSMPFSCWHKINLGDAELKLETVYRKDDLEKGLSGRASLPSDTGLLFAFEKEDYYGIWMKEMNFPIDIIWMDRDLKVVHIKENAEPNSYPTVFKPTAQALYVLEANSGFASRSKIKIGDHALILK